MTSRVLVMPPAPRYDPDKDGNPFEWIVRSAEAVKVQRKAAALQYRLKHVFQTMRPRPEER